MTTALATTHFQQTSVFYGPPHSSSIAQPISWVWSSYCGRWIPYGQVGLGAPASESVGTSYLRSSEYRSPADERYANLPEAVPEPASAPVTTAAPATNGTPAAMQPPSAATTTYSAAAVENSRPREEAPKKSRPRSLGIRTKKSAVKSTARRSKPAQNANSTASGIVRGRAPVRDLTSFTPPENMQGDGEGRWKPTILSASTIDFNELIWQQRSADEKALDDLAQTYADVTVYNDGRVFADGECQFIIVTDEMLADLKALRRRIKNRGYTQAARKREKAALPAAPLSTDDAL